MTTSLIILGGGRGTRMGSDTPKQFLPLQGKALILHSLDLFLSLELFHEVIIVCAPEYRPFFSDYPLKFAFPGLRRQDSLYNALQVTSPQSEWICVHDGARPFVKETMVRTLIEEGKKRGAATTALPVKNTLKEAGQDRLVTHTPDRARFWEVQTPQLVRRDILEKGFALAMSGNIEVTDDVSLAELAGHEVLLIPGCNKNIKITVPEDLHFAEWLLQQIPS